MEEGIEDAEDDSQDFLGLFLHNGNFLMLKNGLGLFWFRV